MTITKTEAAVVPSAPPEYDDVPIVYGAVAIPNEDSTQNHASSITNVTAASAIPSNANHRPTTATTCSSTNTRRPPSTTTTTVVHVPPPSSSSQAAVHPPPGVAAGGTWGSIKHTGGNTWALCGIISILGCMFFCFPCGVFAFCCPCDDRDVYMVNQRVYDHKGNYLGPSRRFDFRHRS